jgi:Holliday junction resolvase RusA-like endonuclease
MTKFFMAMIPPTSTKQQRGWSKTKTGKVISYDRANANAEGKLMANLAKHIPPHPYTGAIRVCTKWLFPIRGQHKDGEPYTKKPDVDNLCKSMYDIMTRLGYWKDDAQIVSGITEKFWSKIPGIYVCIEELSNGDQ